MSVRKLERALISVSDKTGLVELANSLQAQRVELVSTGGTRKALENAGLVVRDISELTGFPEILDGRVKTLHPIVHGGILAMRDNAEHQGTVKQHAIPYFDAVICNLYPFETTVAKPGASHAEIIENIDIGGPSMVRSAAKNYADVLIVTDPSQYAEVIGAIQQGEGTTSLALREKLAAAAFARIAAYDCAIDAYFSGRIAKTGLPQTLSRSWIKKSSLRYGENPHQGAAFYIEPDAKATSVATANVLHGKELSFNNILDLDSALNLVREFAEPAVAVIKHNNPCGVAMAEHLAAALQKAHAGDPLSAFGGVFGFNREIDEPTALLLTEPNRFVECLIAPSYSKAALEILTTRPSWKKSVRLLATGPFTARTERSWDYRKVVGGLLLQDRDDIVEDPRVWKTVTKTHPTEDMIRDLSFAWLVCKHVKSNAIVFAKDRMVVGVGAGQMSRVDSVQIATRKAGERSQGAVMASDAFFPFRDNIDLAAEAGIKAIVQPGGSVRDQDSIDACNSHGIAMMFTGIRHFRH